MNLNFTSLFRFGVVFAFLLRFFANDRIDILCSKFLSTKFMDDMRYAICDRRFETYELNSMYMPYHNEFHYPEPELMNL